MYELKNDPTAFGELKLVEEFVDPEFQRDGVTPKCQAFFNHIKTNHVFQPGYVILLDEIDGKKVGELSVVPVGLDQIKGNHHRFTVIMWTRMLWKAGLIRRFITGRWQNYYTRLRKGDPIQGKSWGIRYLW